MQQFEFRVKAWNRAAVCTMQNQGVDPFVNSMLQYIRVVLREEIRPIECTDTASGLSDIVAAYQRDPHCLSDIEIAKLIRSEYVRFCAQYLQRKKTPSASSSTATGNSASSDIDFLTSATLPNLSSARCPGTFPLFGIVDVDQGNWPWDKCLLAWYFNTLPFARRSLDEVLKEIDKPSCTIIKVPVKQDLVAHLTDTVRRKITSLSAGIDADLLLRLKDAAKDCAASVTTRSVDSSAFATGMRGAVEVVLTHADESNGETFAAAVSPDRWAAASDHLRRTARKYVTDQLSAAISPNKCHGKRLEKLIDVSLPADEQKSYMPFLMRMHNLKRCCTLVADIKAVTTAFDWLLNTDNRVTTRDRKWICDQFLRTLETLGEVRHDNGSAVAKCLKNMANELDDIATAAWEKQLPVLESIRAHNELAQRHLNQLDEELQKALSFWRRTVEGLYSVARNTPLSANSLAHLAEKVNKIPTSGPSDRLLELLKDSIPSNADLRFVAKLEFPDPITLNVGLLINGQTRPSSRTFPLTEKQAADLCLITFLASH